MFDVKALMDKASAQFAIADYVRMVKPVYEAKGDGTQVARAAMDVFERIVKQPSCCCSSAGLTYSNKIRIGYLLDSQADRYLEQPTGAYSKLALVKRASLSPSQEFSGAVPVKRPDLPALNGEIISPVTRALAWVKDFPQIVNLSAITFK